MDGPRHVPRAAEPVRPLQLHQRRRSARPRGARDAALVGGSAAQHPLLPAALERAHLGRAPSLRREPAPAPTPLAPLEHAGGAGRARPLPAAPPGAARARGHGDLRAGALPRLPARVARQPRGAGLAGLRYAGAGRLPELARGAEAPRRGAGGGALRPLHAGRRVRVLLHRLRRRLRDRGAARREAPAARDRARALRRAGGRVPRRARRARVRDARVGLLLGSLPRAGDLRWVAAAAGGHAAGRRQAPARPRVADRRAAALEDRAGVHRGHRAPRRAAGAPRQRSGRRSAGHGGRGPRGSGAHGGAVVAAGIAARGRAGDGGDLVPAAPGRERARGGRGGGAPPRSGLVPGRARAARRSAHLGHRAHRRRGAWRSASRTSSTGR